MNPSLTHVLYIIFQVQRRLQRLDVSANHQCYIRSHGRIAECYFIHNEAPDPADIVQELWYSTPIDFTDESKRTRQVYGPRVIDISNDNGKALLDFVFGDVFHGKQGTVKSGPRHWSTYCASLVEHPSFEVVLQEKKPSKVSLGSDVRAAGCSGSHRDCLSRQYYLHVTAQRQAAQEAHDARIEAAYKEAIAAKNATAAAMLASITGEPSAGPSESIA